MSDVAWVLLVFTTVHCLETAYSLYLRRLESKEWKLRGKSAYSMGFQNGLSDMLELINLAKSKSEKKVKGAEKK